MFIIVLVLLLQYYLQSIECNDIGKGGKFNRKSNRNKIIICIRPISPRSEYEIYKKWSNYHGILANHQLRKCLFN